MKQLDEKQFPIGHSRSSVEEPEVSIADLYPELSVTEQTEAAHWLNAYLQLVQCIFERVNSVPDSTTQDLTSPERLPTMPM